MRQPLTRPSKGLALRRGQDPVRPIASELKLGGAHAAVIDQSHQRCAALGVSPIKAPDLAPVAQASLNVIKDRNRRLFDHAAPVMDMLYEQIVNSNSMVLLTDATGTVLHSIGDDAFVERASRVALRPGAVWSETAKGTNAIGTALVEESATLVHADEHFVHANQFLTCSAAPILDPRGNMLGVLDVSGDHRSYHQHTMALVKMSARMIENGWLSDDYSRDVRLHLHSRVDFIGTLMEGIVAVSPEGRIVGANRGALEQLGLSGAALRMHSLQSLLGTTVATLVDRFRSPLATPVPLRLPNGQLLHAVARFNWPVWTSLAEVAQGQPISPSTQADTRSSRPLARAHTTDTALDKLLTGDPQMNAVVTRLRRALHHPIPLLLMGETGTGKEQLARALHAEAGRTQQAFVAVNCASLSPHRQGVELFGQAAGVFKGETQPAIVGKIEQAHGGTLFLDDVGELPLALQAPLLQALQAGQVTPWGSTRPMVVDVAVVCATRHNLRQLIRRQAFREDLYGHINGLALRLPTLRERQDLPALAQRWLQEQRTAQTLQLSPAVLELFQRYAWPGNLRQLFNVLRAAYVLADQDTQIRLEHLPDDLVEEAGLPAQSQPVTGRRLDDIETDAIRKAVAQAGGNISAASQQLGISRNTIYRKLRANARQR